MGRWSRAVAVKYLDWLAQPVGLHWLDVGCGNGAFTEELIRHSMPAKVDAIDASSDQLRHAASRLSNNIVEFREGDAQTLQFTDNSFDVASMALVISFVPDARKAVHEMVRVVRPGGMVATYMWDGQARDSIPTAPFRWAADALGFGQIRQLPPSARLTTRDGLEELWRHAGTKAVESTRLNIKVSFKDLDDFWQSCTALPNPSVVLLRSLSDSDIARVRAWLDENLPRDATGAISYDAYANGVKGIVP